MADAGVYLHIPFCRARCSYCDFATGMYESGAAENYVRALCRETREWREIDQPLPVDTIYFGGGTPSLLAPAQLEAILDTVRQRFEIVDDSEITIEINPASIVTNQSPAIDELSREKLRSFRALGINRASFGAQTFDDRELKQLGRTHAAADIPSTFRELRR